MIDKENTQPEGEQTSSSTNQVVSSIKEDLDMTFDMLDIKLIAERGGGFESYLKRIMDSIQSNKDELKGAYIVCAEHKLNGHDRNDFAGLDDTINILSKDPEAKIILMSVVSFKDLMRMKKGKMEYIMEHPNVEHIDILTSYDKKISSLKFRHAIDTEKYISAIDSEAKMKMLVIRHILQGIKDPYNPQDKNERYRLELALNETKNFFPGLDTLDKMLDFVIHVNIDIPEKMKGQKIEGVYCDVDGTLIEYVGIHSGKEGTQPLRQSVVDLLKKYEQEGKEIFIRTGGDAKKKEAYLRTLGITWPVLNKYDYAGAMAEIVIDDTDQNAFIVQSKIFPETYIDTRNLV